MLIRKEALRIFESAPESNPRKQLEGIFVNPLIKEVVATDGKQLICVADDGHESDYFRSQVEDGFVPLKEPIIIPRYVFEAAIHLFINLPPEQESRYAIIEQTEKGDMYRIRVVQNSIYFKPIDRGYPKYELIINREKEISHRVTLDIDLLMGVLGTLKEIAQMNSSHKKTITFNFRGEEKPVDIYAEYNIFGVLMPLKHTVDEDNPNKADKIEAKIKEHWGRDRKR